MGHPNRAKVPSHFAPHSQPNFADCQASCVPGHLRLTLFGWLPKYACQVRTDALLCAFPKRMAPEIKKLRELPLRALGVNSDAPALRVSFAEPRWMKHCSNIRQEYPRPEVARHTLTREIPEDEDFVLTGCGGSGKSTAMREFAARLKAKGKQVYVISFQNSVAAKSNGMTCHQFCRKMAAGEILSLIHI